MEYLDTPNKDNTPQAHPAFWRGKSSGIDDTLKIVSDIMMGLDNGSGRNNHPGIEGMRQALITWRDVVDKAMNKGKSVEKA